MIGPWTRLELWVCCMTGLVLAVRFYGDGNSSLLGGIFGAMLTVTFLFVVLFIKNRPKGPKSGGEA